jgi:HK97 family phage portal protein
MRNTTYYVMPGVYEDEENRGIEYQLSVGDPGVWSEIFGDFASASGERITVRTALAVPAVIQACQLIAGDVAKLPLYVYREDGEFRTKATKHRLYRVLYRQPNGFQPAFGFWKQIMLHALLWGHAYCYIRRTPRSIELAPPFNPETVTIVEDQSGNAPYLYRVSAGGEETFYPPTQILHVQNLSWTNTDLIHAIEIARDSLGLSRSAEKYSAMFFRQGAQPGGVFEMPPDMRKQAQEGFMAMYKEKLQGADKFFKYFPLGDGVTFKQTSFSPEDAQVNELRTHQVADVARLFNLPPHRLGLAVNSSYKSLEQENRAYHDTTISHWLHAITSECWLKLLTSEEQKSERFELQHDLSQLIKADIETIHQNGRTAIESGFKNFNEVRRELSLNPREGGDEFLQPLNMGSSQPPEPPPEATEEDDTASRLAGPILLQFRSSLRRIMTGKLSYLTREYKRAPATFWQNLPEIKEELHAAVAEEVEALSVLLDREPGELAADIAERCYVYLEDTLAKAMDGVPDNLTTEALSDGCGLVLRGLNKVLAQ